MKNQKHREKLLYESSSNNYSLLIKLFISETMKILNIIKNYVDVR